MRRKFFTWLLASGGIAAALQFSSLYAQESGSSLYEDDAWYDVTEWFDGNDYNPTDERFFRWDDESFGPRAAGSLSDLNSDRTLFGYDNTTDDDDWYYDYDYGEASFYDDWDTNGLYEMSSRYYDYDNDGYYDGFSSYLDADDDGIYENYTYIDFADSPDTDSHAANAKKDAENSASRQNAKMFSIEGQIASTKKVQGRDGQRLLAQVTHQDRKFLVDMGNAERLTMELTTGDQVTARGPVTMVGDKQVLLAKVVEHDGKISTIDRSPRKLTGAVIETLRARLRKGGTQEHLLVKLRTDSGKQALVDMGPADKLTVRLPRGQKIAVSGFAAKLKDRPVLFASTATVEGQQITVDRRVSNPN